MKIFLTEWDSNNFFRVKNDGALWRFAWQFGYFIVEQYYFRNGSF